LDGAELNLAADEAEEEEDAVVPPPPAGRFAVG
jgi:hypothetical protein